MSAMDQPPVINGHAAHFHGREHGTRRAGPQHRDQASDQAGAQGGVKFRYGAAVMDDLSFPNTRLRLGRIGQLGKQRAFLWITLGGGNDAV